MVPRKLIEHTFRLLPVLILLPLVAGGAAIAFTASGDPEYESRATLWVSESGTVGEEVLGAENTFASPSQRQAQSLSQLVATDNFALNVAQRAGLLDGSSDRDLDWRTLDYVSAEAAALRHIRSTVWASANGTNLMVITSRDSNAERAYRIVGATTSLYLERISMEANRKSDIVISFYQQRLTGALQTLDQLDKQISEYVATHPRAAEFGTFDPAFERLRASFATQNQLVTTLQESLQVAQLDAATTTDSQQGKFALIDAPAVPVEPVARGLKETLLPTAGALVAALMLGASLVYASFVTDHAIRSSADITSLGVPVLAFLPEFDSRLAQPWVLRRLVRRDRGYARRLAADLTPKQMERGA